MGRLSEQKNRPPRAGAIGGDRSRASTCERQKQRTRKQAPRFHRGTRSKRQACSSHHGRKLFLPPGHRYLSSGCTHRIFGLAIRKAACPARSDLAMPNLQGITQKLVCPKTLPRGRSKGFPNHSSTRGRSGRGADALQVTCFWESCRSPCVAPQRLPRMQPRTLHRWQCLVFQGFFT